MTDITEIKRKLAERVLEVAQMLLPGGRREGQEWRVGSIDGERGKSLGVHLVGTKAGIWTDFNSGEGGDLIDLWCAAKRIPLPDAIREAKGYLGISEPQPYRDPKPSYSRPPRPKCTTPRNRVRDYLCEVRAIPPDILARYKVGEDGDRIVFPFLLPDGTLSLAKVRDAVDGAKPKPTTANCEPVLFGWQAVDPNTREIAITEGEIDALALAAYGKDAMSVPFGGGGKGKQNWIENDFERLERFEKIYLVTDMDDPGEQAAVEIAARLGRHRCYRVRLPRKDADECLMGGVAVEEIQQCFEAAENLDPEGLRRAGGFADSVIRLFWPPHDAHIGYSMPYSGLYGKILFRPGEVSLWSGASGSGKSQVISDSIPKWVQEGSRVCLASFEMQPQWTLKRLVKQTGGVDRPVEAFIRETLAYLDAGLLLYEKVGKANVESLLEIFDYARAKYGCDQFVIDSLMRLGIAADDYTAQEQAVYRLIDWTIANNVHTHLVAHSRKGGRDQGVPETEDIKGAMEIGANAFNIITIWRNRKLEEITPEGDRPIMTEEPGVTLNIAKQRNGDFEGKVKLYFNTQTYQYFSPADNRRYPRTYIRDSGSDANLAYGEAAR